MRRQSRLNQRGCTLSNLPRIDNPIESWHHKLNGAIHTYLIVFRLIKTMRTTDDRGPETPPSLVGTPASRPSPAPTHQSTGVGSQLTGSQLSGELIVRESVVRGVSCPGVSCPESIVRESVVQESVVRIPLGSGGGRPQNLYLPANHLFTFMTVFDALAGPRAERAGRERRSK